MPRRPIVVLIVFLAVAVLLIGSRVRDQSPVSAVAPQPDMSSNAAPETATVPAAVDAAAKTSALLDQLANGAEPAMTIPPPAMALAPLPSWDAKLVDVLPELRARADAGDHVAACHIGLALSACAAWLAHRPSPAQLRQIQPDDDEAIERLAWISADMRRPGREKTCDDLPDVALDDRFAYLQQAADAGNGAAMLAYAEGIPMQSIDAIYRHPEWLEAHRQRTPRYVAELIRRGDRFAAFLLSMNGDGMQMSLLSRALNMDQATTATFWYLGREVMSRPSDERTGSTPELKQAAQARARAIHRRYFDQRPFQSGEFKDRFDMANVERCGLIQ